MNLPLDPNQQQALADLQDAYPDLQFVLIGAAALKCHLEIARVTHDIDLALFVEPDDVGPHVLALGWQQHPYVLHRWRHPNGAWMDLVPASPSSIAYGSVNFEGAVLDLTGFDLVFARAERRLLANGTALRIASLPVIAILKIVSWLDRPQERKKDLGDLVRIINDALAVDDARRWESPLIDLPHDEQGPYLMGTEVRKIAATRHRVRIARFRERINPAHGDAFSLLMRVANGAYNERAADHLARVVDAFFRGFEDEAPGAR